MHTLAPQLRAKVKGIEAALEFFIAKKSNHAILGLSTCKMFSLVHCVDAVTSGNKLDYAVAAEFPALFQGIGCIKKMYSMVLKEETTPVIQPVYSSQRGACLTC